MYKLNYLYLWDHIIINDPDEEKMKGAKNPEITSVPMLPGSWLSAMIFQVGRVKSTF